MKPDNSKINKITNKNYFTNKNLTIKPMNLHNTIKMKNENLNTDLNFPTQKMTPIIS